MVKQAITWLSTYSETITGLSLFVLEIVAILSALANLLLMIFNPELVGQIRNGILVVVLLTFAFICHFYQRDIAKTNKDPGGV